MHVNILMRVISSIAYPVALLACSSLTAPSSFQKTGVSCLNLSDYSQQVGCVWSGAQSSNLSKLPILRSLPFSGVESDLAYSPPNSGRPRSSRGTGTRFRDLSVEALT